jgi:hypothetical protein
MVLVVGLDLEETLVGSGCAWTKPQRVGFDFVGLWTEESSGCWTAGGLFVGCLAETNPGKQIGWAEL